MQDIEEIEVKLRNKQYALEQRAQILSDELKEAEIARQNNASSAQAKQGVSDEIEAQTQQELQQIKHAILRIKQGVYSQCELCHGPIEAKRLLVLPYTALCFRCVRAEDV